MARVPLKLPAVVKRGDVDSAALKEALDTLRTAAREIDAKVEDVAKRLAKLEKQSAR